MKTLREQSHMVDLLFTLALFCVFAASSLIIVIIGADVYGRTAQGLDKNFNLNTALCYVTEKIRQNDTTGAVRLGELEGREALVLDTTVDGQTYYTYIYFHDGALREIYTAKENHVSVDDGQSIVELSDFEIRRRAADLFRFSAVSEDGMRAETVVALRSAAE